ncbi:MAG: penicillin-binding protein 1A [Rhodospirillaceae bacterium]|nr:penicillin-binding protein 1A [Rhodospirillaceae bacterium]
MLRTLAVILSLMILVAFAGVGGGVYVFYKFGRGLPDYKQLADYEPPVMTRVHAGDGRLLAEYAEQKRVFVPQAAMPRRVVRAFLSAEDKNFYYHPGIDPMGIARAVVTNIKNITTGRRLVGASTITQQVAKNFLLSADLTLERKVKEAILAFRIERALEKNRILELYLNEIYLGFGSYGVAAAALNYFNKSLDSLTIAEAAFLAALPKAPNNYNPFKHPKAARGRRDWVVGRMLKDGVITPEQARIAKLTPLITRKRQETEYVKADYFAEEVRRELAQRYGETNLYRGGLVVRTTLDPKYQRIADKALRNGLIAYDRRHGWRGPITNIDASIDWLGALAKVKHPKALGAWRLAVVREVLEDRADIGVDDGSIGAIPLAEMKWARPWLKGEKLGKRVSSPAEVLQAGDVVAVEPVLETKDGKAYPDSTYQLRQLPEIEGSVVALDPHTGRILAMSGGFSYERSQFNRVIQARRQPGSAFKPFVYLAALDKGFTPASLILDAPFVIDQGPGLPKWRPANYTKKFYGPSTMRLGLEKSRNLMTVRLAQTIGIEAISEYAAKFGIAPRLPKQLSMSLGAGETTLLKLTAAYAMLVNGGKQIRPTLIDRIQDRHGKTVFKHDPRACQKCLSAFWTQQPVPAVPDHRKQVADAASAYQMVSMLEGVVQRGTGRRMKDLGKPLAGKTGTTNQALDTWFIGFSPDLAVGVFSGFDTPRSLGKREQGASVSAPIFKEFMKNALADKPAIPFRIPPGIRLVRVEANTGRPARPGDRRVILEAFKPGTVPTGQVQVLDGSEETPTSAPTEGTGGLY